MQPRQTLRNDFFAAKAALTLLQHHIALLQMRLDRDGRVPYPKELEPLEYTTARVRKIVQRIRSRIT